MRVALVLTLVACSIPGKHAGTVTDGSVASDSPRQGSDDGGGGPVSEDGPPGPFGCFGHSLPTTAPPTVTVQGTATTLDSVSGSQPLSGALLEVYATSGGGAVAQAFSDAQGNFTMSVTTGGTPFDGLVMANSGSDLPTLVFPSQPFDGNTTLPVTMITESTLSFAGSLANVSVIGTDAQFAILIVDCDGTPLAGATVTTSVGVVRYTSGGLPSKSATATDASGEAFVFNVTPGNFVVAGVAANGDPLRSHTVVGDTSGFTIAMLQP